MFDRHNQVDIKNTKQTNAQPDGYSLQDVHKKVYQVTKIKAVNEKGGL